MLFLELSLLEKLDFLENADDLSQLVLAPIFRFFSQNNLDDLKMKGPYLIRREDELLG